MSEEKTGFSIGMMRMKYLDLANMSFATGNYRVCSGNLKSFLDTVDEKSKAGIRIKSDFDNIMINKNRQIKQLEEAKKEAGYLESRDMERDGRDDIEINAMHDMKNICWCISLSEGLFNE